MRVSVFTTSYPRHEDDFAGRFVSDAVKRLRERGVEVDVVAPGRYNDYGLTFNGAGILRNIKRRPWVAPLLFLSMVRSLRTSARRSDLVHAHWLAGGVIALFAGKPFVCTLHGTISGGLLDDFKLCDKAPWLVRLILNRAAAVICVSRALTDAATRAGVRNVHFIPNGVDIPEGPGDECDPPYVFYTGRLAPEKGADVLADAADGLNLVICGNGPLRERLPQTRGFVSREELNDLYAGAAIVVIPSRKEGFGVVCAEAMAWGKPVIVGATGGLLNLVEDGVSGLHVPPGDAGALRAAIDELLADREKRVRLGTAARESITAICSWEGIIDRTIAVYESITA
jgi:D-inositol-3-phosphate glycosyltransferase